MANNYPINSNGWDREYSRSTITPSTAPTIAVTPFEPPSYDYGRLESLTQQFASPALSRLRRGVREATMAGQYIENPAVRAIMARRSLEGYGTGLGSALAGARGTAASIYGTEYQNQVDAARRAWEERMARERGQISTAQQSSISNMSRLGLPTGGTMSAPQRQHTTSYIQHDPLASLRGGTSYTAPNWYQSIGNVGSVPSGMVANLNFDATPMRTMQPNGYGNSGIFDEYGRNIISNPYYR